MQIIVLMGLPGSGAITVSTGLIARAKMQGWNAELLSVPPNPPSLAGFMEQMSMLNRMATQDQQMVVLPSALDLLGAWSTPAPPSRDLNDVWAWAQEGLRLALPDERSLVWRFHRLPERADPWLLAPGHPEVLALQLLEARVQGLGHRVMPLPAGLTDYSDYLLSDAWQGPLLRETLADPSLNPAPPRARL